eukprot:11151813-Karenia_brevis.AAC.1
MENEIQHLQSKGAPGWFIESHKFAFAKSERQKKRISSIENNLCTTNREVADLKQQMAKLHNEVEEVKQSKRI